MTEAEFQEFHAATARPLWAYVARVSGQYSLADDVVQEAYLRFLETDLDGVLTIEHKRSYLFKIAANLLVDHYRRKRPTEELREIRYDTSFPDGDLERAMEKLTAQERQMLWLAYVEGFSHREISGQLGLKEASIRPLLYRARQRLAMLLGHVGVMTHG